VGGSGPKGRAVGALMILLDEYESSNESLPTFTFLVSALLRFGYCGLGSRQSHPPFFPPLMTPTPCTWIGAVSLGSSYLEMRYRARSIPGFAPVAALLH
jgi:hypothetical protein